MDEFSLQVIQCMLSGGACQEKLRCLQNRKGSDLTCAILGGGTHLRKVWVGSLWAGSYVFAVQDMGVFCGLSTCTPFLLEYPAPRVQLYYVFMYLCIYNDNILVHNLPYLASQQNAISKIVYV